MPHVVITGGAGFVGSHLCDHYISQGWQVSAIDNLSSGRMVNIDHLRSVDGFQFHHADIRDQPTLPLGAVDLVLHFASPASPPFYLEHPFLSLETGSIGTAWALELAGRNDCRFVLASTSEVYGDPQVHPQREDYWGHVNPIGPRSVYDEAKRYAEALTMAWRDHRDLDAGIVRIFNTYGPRMRPDDGRVITNFVVQALAGAPLTVAGDGSQTRSFCFVSDLIRGVAGFAALNEGGPVNLGNPGECSMLELARTVISETGSVSEITNIALPVDDPTRRCPDIGLASELVAWQPEVDFEDGLRRTIAWFVDHD